MSVSNTMDGKSKAVIICSTFWLLIANLVGLLMSYLLINQQAGNLIAPISYGRLVPLHLNFHLYGWLSVPILGLLIYWYYVSKKLSLLILISWSLCLLAGGYSWLTGNSSGKIFLEWHDIYGRILEATFFLLWAILSISYCKQQCKIRDNLAILILKLILLTVLGALPLLFHYALDRSVYPAINPTSGGPTGTSLLGSTLGLIIIFGCLPALLKGALIHYKAMLLFAFLLIIHFIIFSMMDHGHVTNLTMTQYLGLGSLVVWIPIIYWYYSRFEWPSGSRIWILSFSFWGSLLTLSATFMFLPGQLEYVKFTSFLVAHSHIAMAGMLTAICMLILTLLSKLDLTKANESNCLSNKPIFYLWNFSLALHLLTLIGLGIIENISPANSFRADIESHTLDIVRFCSGLLMTSCSVFWLSGSIKSLPVLKKPHQ